MTGFRQVVRAVAFYPISAVYAAVAVVVAAVAGHTLRPDVALVIIGMAALLVLQLSMRHEVSTVHGLVNSQHDALVARIDQLTAALVAAGVQVPHDDTAKTRTGGGRP